ncbi:MAG: hypothetical protein JW881_21695 [Spirochaetales bacterium]|nr:hypothetical protein [Spirochaetales bacterium]
MKTIPDMQKTKYGLLMGIILCISCLSPPAVEKEIWQRINRELQTILSEDDGLRITNLRGFYYPGMGMYIRGYYDGVLDIMEYFKPDTDYDGVEGSVTVLNDCGYLMYRLVDIRDLDENDSFFFFITNGEDELFRMWKMEEALSLVARLKSDESMITMFPLEELIKIGILNGRFSTGEGIEFYDTMNEASITLRESMRSFGFSHIDAFIFPGISLCFICEIDEISEEKQNEVDSLFLTQNGNDIPFITVYQKRKDVSVVYSYDIENHGYKYIVYDE